jgi:N-acyl-D-amino-acid deacylase
MQKKVLLFTCIAVFFIFTGFIQSETTDFDILIKNGKIVNGTGNPWFYGDIGIKDDTIEQIGFLEGKTAGLIIDTKGQVVSPGFIDMHTHCDWGLGRTETRANLNYLSQGVTTVVTGNCGHGTFHISETVDVWKKNGIGTNAILLVGFGAIRREVMGTENVQPTSSQLEEMLSILDKALSEGAWGLSTGLQYIPDRYASTEEIISLTKVVEKYGGIYSSHMRSEEEKLVEAVEETVRIGKESGARVNIAHLKASGKNNWGSMREAIELMEKARKQGIEITADMYPYDKSATTSLQIIFNIPEDMEPFAGMEKKLRNKMTTQSERIAISQQYLEAIVTALEDKDKRSRIKKITLEGDPNKVNWVAKGGWYNFTIIDSKKHPDLIGKMFCDLAQEQGLEEFDIAAELFIQERNDIKISLSTMSEEDIKLALLKEFVMISSDGSAVPFKIGNVHPRNYGSFARVFRKYVREENILSLENAVRKQTSLPAQLLRLKNRGLILEGYKADIVIFDPATIQDNATYLNPHQYSSGIEYVILNGKVSIKNSKFNNTLNGKPLLLTENN